jgi:hypothetical protein
MDQYVLVIEYAMSTEVCVPEIEIAGSLRGNISELVVPRHLTKAPPSPNISPRTQFQFGDLKIIQ